MHLQQSFKLSSLSYMVVFFRVDYILFFCNFIIIIFKNNKPKTKQYYIYIPVYIDH